MFAAPTLFGGSAVEVPQKHRDNRPMSSSRPSASPTDLAAIDIGSNSFRLEIGQISPGRYKRVEYLKETVRLGAGLDTDGLLTEDAAARGLACPRRFAAAPAGYAPGQVRARGHADAARGPQPRPVPRPAPRPCWATPSRSSPAARKRA